MSEIPKAYEPQSVESKWYQFWLDQNAFTANPHSTKPAYSIVIPPPNVTGVLTLGHVLNNTIQDILARKARMDGKEVLWLPGTDHAGIATQTVVERTLKKAGEIKHRNDLGREKFLERVWEWKDKHGGIILQQLKALGASCDWTRTRFTMDPEYSRCVSRVFVDLYKKGHIYRGKRMVNWCPASLTALSDEEVIMKEQKGFMYHFKVEVAEQPGTFLTIATTRPETIPGDTAVAVNPKDPRYQHLIGKHVYRALPLDVPKVRRKIPIIADEHVDFEFGTGVLKVTPAHDKADYEIHGRMLMSGLENGGPTPLTPIDVLTPDAKMTAEAGVELAGLDRFAARKKAAEILEAAGLLEKTEPYTNNVGFSERADVPIEPRLSEQWFLKYPSVPKSKDCVATGAMKFYPERWAKVYDHWMTGIQDWCVSRQLWWGHRIPVWRHNFPIPQHAYDKLGANDPQYRATPNGIEYCGLDAPSESGWTQDPDVLDTWFSSWLWPFATMGWPENTETLKKFYPTTDLVTGPDIIFFWVARMIMAGYEWMGEMPFRNVYFTGIIRDKQGRKMSKSLGNSPDPLDLINTYGADALRFGIMRSAPQGQDLLFDEQSVELGRNFANKLWNACRFRQMQGSAPVSGVPPAEFEDEIRTELLTSDDKWILLKLDQAIREVTDALNNYKFNEAANVLYRFFWSEYCDWYVEATKAVLQAPIDPNNPRSAARRENTLAVIDLVLSNTLRLFHPFLPFITEELWNSMGFNKDLPEGQGGDTIMFAHWPKPFDTDFKDHYALDDCYLERVENKYEVVRQGRNLRSEARIAANIKVRFVLKPLNDLPMHDIAVLKILLNAEQFEVNAEFEPTKGTARALTSLGELFLPLEGLIDLAAERARLQKELAKIRTEIEKVSQKLSNPNFSQKVPPQVLAEHEQRLADWNTKHTQVLAALDALGQG
ncbi:MAG TPA: valine--tRNA ligase [Candidatus Limnocylindria bacterium]|nr:valine--tRNA ligase [Candidatus Limnocylindria bacterium]